MHLKIPRTFIKIIFMQVLWSLQLSCKQVQRFIKTTISSVFHDLENEHTAGVTGRQEMPTPLI